VSESPRGLADVSLQFASATDVGHKRAVNEDSVLAELPIFIVADGMGGHEAGDKASAAVVDAFSRLLSDAPVSIDDVTEAVEYAHNSVEAIAELTTRGAGSTLTGIVLVEHAGSPQWLVVNVGDSRVYRLHGDDLAQLTIDHSVVAQLVADGTLRPEEAATYVGRNVITRAVGSPESPPDFWLHPLVTGERLLVCSDGLTGELDDEMIRVALTSGASAQQTADDLLKQALDRGGRDNVTLIVVDVIAGGLEASDPSLSEINTETTEVRLNDTAELPSRKGRPPLG